MICVSVSITKPNWHRCYFECVPSSLSPKHQMHTSYSHKNPKAKHMCVLLCMWIFHMFALLPIFNIAGNSIDCKSLENRRRTRMKFKWDGANRYAHMFWIFVGCIYSARVIWLWPMVFVYLISLWLLGPAKWSVQQLNIMPWHFISIENLNLARFLSWHIKNTMEEKEKKVNIWQTIRTGKHSLSFSIRTKINSKNVRDNTKSE